MLVNPSAQDLNYQPAIKTSIYTPPKVSIFKRLILFVLTNTKKLSFFTVSIFKRLILFVLTNTKKLSFFVIGIFIKIFKKLFSLKTIFTEFEFLAIALFVLAIFAGILLILNYFNIFSLSYFYPKYLGFLPHRYDAVANNAILSDVPYSARLQDYQIQGKLKKISNNRIVIEYENHFVEFIQGHNTTCSQLTIEANAKATEREVFHPAFCSDLLSSINYGKNATVTYKKDNIGQNVIFDISIVK